MFEVLEIMNGYEKLIKQMRKQGAVNNESGVRLGQMINKTDCAVGDLTLYKEDLLIAEHLVTGYTAADGTIIQPLKKGDAVLVKRLSSEKYAIIERVISNA